MALSTLTGKGQTTIPKSIREHLDLKPGDRLEFIIDRDGRVVLLPATLDVADLAGALPRPDKALSVDAMDRVIRQRAGR